ncbi:MAG: metal-sulfur cluster assembly factor [Candidatus Absconditabacteria bacterium]|nr:metal-sulfur cluster assembly factor [Candidatus Absconditabacteria bacterium]MDD3868232.1 metal-sulfur cluster assembly factor [Candidatus Absconditabacteria bacterium]MDD4714640.1 metal-sulfur cluster assembly factor [Candidatus Absconditabacteria bacterium]
MLENNSIENIGEVTELISSVEEKLKTVYDPEFPLVDIFTMGLIYDIQVDVEEKIVVVTMTFTTPACPMADMLISMVEQATSEALPARGVEVVISFEPMRSPKMIKDEDLQRMFE